MRKKLDKNILKVPDVEKIGIYAIRNTENGKMYIGSTTNIKRRCMTHRNNLINGFINHKIDNDIKKKSDLEKFEFCVLKVFEDGSITGEELAQLEYEYQLIYNTIKDGYNFWIDKKCGRREGKNLLKASPLKSPELETITVLLKKGINQKIIDHGYEPHQLIKTLLEDYINEL